MIGGVVAAANLNLQKNLVDSDFSKEFRFQPIQIQISIEEKVENTTSGSGFRQQEEQIQIRKTNFSFKEGVAAAASKSGK